jgi:DNA adenine methylase
LHSGDEAAFNAGVAPRDAGSSTRRALPLSPTCGEQVSAFARPFLKWAGGKSQLLPQFERLYPKGPIGTYIEGFLGSGAVFFHVAAKLKPERTVLCDNNEELIRTFEAVRKDVEGVLSLLRSHKKKHGLQYFHRMRTYKPTTPTTSAARLIYLNKTCFNGLYRVNSKGGFNVPIGRYTNPRIFDEDELRQASRALRDAKLRTSDFRELPTFAEEGDFIYLDPPYHPRSDTAYFTSYTRTAFGVADQEELAAVFAALARRKCKVMLSNSDTPLVHKLYRGFRIEKVSARRNINSRAERRGPIDEVVVLSYDPGDP